MNLEYKILWIDDQINEFLEDEYVNKVEEHLEDEGFVPCIKLLDNSADISQYLNEDWDLILTDYNMAEKNGIEVIKFFRNHSVFTEILFYTAQNELKNPGEINRISFYRSSKDTSYTHHEGVTNEILRLIDLTIKKFQDIVVVRGLIMEETSILDAKIDKLVTNYLSCEDSSCKSCTNKTKCNPLSTPIMSTMEKQFEDKLKLVRTKNFKKIRNDSFVFSADYKRMILGQILSELNCDDFSKDYKNDIINTRNLFAHAILLKDEKGKRYFYSRSGEIVFDEEKCRQIRKDIIKYKEKIDAVENLV